MSPSDKRILIASPWLSDVELKGCRWHPSQISAMVDTAKFCSLVDVLGTLVDLGYEVDLVVATRRGKFLPPKNNSQVMREKKLIENATSRGVRCSFKPDFFTRRNSQPRLLCFQNQRIGQTMACGISLNIWNLSTRTDSRHTEFQSKSKHGFRYVSTSCRIDSESKLSSARKVHKPTSNSRNGYRQTEADWR